MHIENIISLGKLKVKVTDDGKLWMLKTKNKWAQLKPKNEAFINNLTSNCKTCVVVGKKGFIGLIDNKGNLSSVKSLVNYDISKVIWSKNEFMAIDSNSDFLVSSNGKNWTIKGFTK